MHQRHWKRVVEAQQLEIDLLRAALKPFADFAEQIDTNYTSQGYPGRCPVGLNPMADADKERLHLGAFRQARAVLTNGQFVEPTK